MALTELPKNCDVSVRRAIQKLSYKLGPQGHPSFNGLKLNGLAPGLLHTNSVGNVLAGSLYVPEYGALFIED